MTQDRRPFQDLCVFYSFTGAHFPGGAEIESLFAQDPVKKNLSEGGAGLLQIHSRRLSETAGAAGYIEDLATESRTKMW